MDKLFETAVFTRKSLLQILDSMTEEQIVKIPESHRNSVFWNVAHLMVTQQLLTYRLSGLPLHIDEVFVERYGKGSEATEEVSDQDIEFVKKNIVLLCEQSQQDYDKGLFRNYKPYMTSTGIELTSVEEALKFSAFHDGIHLGVILSLKKLVQNKDTSKKD
jgi:hypothetical protein